jgi:thymidylate synthase (FAD)
LKVELLSHTPSDPIRNALKDSNTSYKEMLHHLSFTFAIESISRSCTHQLVRHRVGSYSQQSQRFIEVKELNKHVVLPETISKNAPEPFNTFIEMTSDTYRRLLEMRVPREDARFLLPNATETQMLFTMDGEALCHFFSLRCCNRAQWEIKALADDMLIQVRAVEPCIFSKAGPYCCQHGQCPEGRFSCGKIQEVREKYVQPFGSAP